MPLAELAMYVYWVSMVIGGSGWLFLVASGRDGSLPTTGMTIFGSSLLLVHVLLMPQQIEGRPWQAATFVLHGLVAGPMLQAVLMALRELWLWGEDDAKAPSCKGAMIRIESGHLDGCAPGASLRA